MKYAVATESARRQCLRIIFERIWRRLRAFVLNLQKTAGAGLFRVALELIENKIDVRAVLLNGARLNETFNPQLIVKGLFPHSTQFGDGHVIAFVRAHASEGEPADGAQNHHNGDADAY